MKAIKKRVGVFGLWHLGSVYAAALASKGFEVTGFDFDKKVIKNLRKNTPPLFEPNLEETIKNHNKKNLNFTLSIKEFFKDKDYIFITHDVPVDDKDHVQMKIIDRTFKLLQRYMTPKTTVVISSQIPIGTSKKLVHLLLKKIKDPKVIYFPENLKIGQAFDSFLNPERIILGSNNSDVLEDFKKDFNFFKCPFIGMSLESSEMVKHALNNYLATCISFSSELSDLSEKTGANMSDVVLALKLDKRVSPYAPINPGLGFAGGTLGRDVQTLKKIAKNLKYQPKLLDAVYSVNQDRLPMLVSKINSVYPSLKGKFVGILGLTYKPNTNTLRRSMSLELIKKLKSKGCRIKAFDPAIISRIKDYSFIEINKNLDSFFKDLDLAILMTDWAEFKDINIGQANQMNKKVIIDTKNFLKKELYEKEGFKILRMGESK